MKAYTYGINSEAAAKKYLLDRGYNFLEENFRTKSGEIDLIFSNHEGTVIFIEVKARQSDKYGYPEEAVTFYKQNTIRRVAELYLQKNRLYDINVRFDVITILGDKITHIADAF